MPDKHSRHGRGAWATIVLVNFLILALLVLSALAYSTPAFRLDAGRMIPVASVSLLLVFAWMLWSWRALTRSLFNPYALFLMAAVLFNGGQAFLEIFDLNEFDLSYTYRDVYSRFSSETILETIFLVTLGLTAFHAGGLLSIPITHKRSSTRQEIEAEKRDAPSTAKALRVVGWGLLAISIVPVFVVTRESLAIVSSYGYLGLFQQQQPFSDVFRILGDAIVPATIFLLAGSRNLRSNIMVSGITVFSYCSALIFVGNRHGAIMLLVAWGWTYHRCIRPVPKTVLLGLAALMLLIVLPVVAILRLQSGPERFSLSSLLDTFSSIENPVVAILQETGFSMATVAYTIELVPGYRDFDLGVSYLYGMSGIIPNRFWEVHPAVAHGLLDDWLIRIADPVVASSLGNSYGFSFIAEAYLNFGWLGAPFALGIMGFLLGWFVMWADRSADLAKIAMVGAFTAFFLIFARGESNEVVRALVWYALIPYLGVLSLRLLAKKPRRAGVQPRSAKLGPATTRVGPRNPVSRS